MHLETSSFLGVTTNPFNRALTCGGSSGGEGALVGGHGSPWGVTTDIGGSTRGPAAKWVIHQNRKAALSSLSR
jgi:Asp-tRNA(Asn)/Glu-tRNA(Gln) amidotransferase A subunit family amidase